MTVAIIHSHTRRAMINRLMKREKAQPILGYDIDKPRITAAGWLLVLVYLGVPAMLIGGLIDVLIQLVTGRCVGVWCLF